MKGGRFDYGGIPSDFNLIGIEEVVKSIARKRYRQDKGRKNLNLNDYQLIMNGLEAGSTIIDVSVVGPHGLMDPNDEFSAYIQQGLNEFAKGISEGFDRNDIESIIRKNRKKLFPSIKQGETADFIVDGMHYPVKESYYGYNMNEYDGTYSLPMEAYANVFSINVNKKVCGLQLIINRETKTLSNLSYKELISEEDLIIALKNKRSQKIIVGGSALFINSSFHKFESIEIMKLVNPKDVKMQFEDIYNLCEGWAGFEGGEIFEREKYQTIQNLIQDLIESGIPNPTIYPMPENEVVIDWEDEDVCLKILKDVKSAILSDYKREKDYEFNLEGSDIYQILKTSLQEALNE